MKYTFLEALGKVNHTKQRIKIELGQWNKVCNDGRPFLKDENNHIWWPSIEDQKAEIWEVEPEAIYVWCDCDLNGHSWIYTRNIKGTGFSKTEYAQFPDTRLFSQDLKKYKLVPVDGE